MLVQHEVVHLSNRARKWVALRVDRCAHSDAIAFDDDVIGAHACAFFTDAKRERQVATVAEPLVAKVTL